MTDHQRHRKPRHTCPVTKKMQYKNAGEAKRALAEIARVYHVVEGLAATPQTPYRCRWCRRWHVTTMNAAESREFRLARHPASM